MTALAWRLAEWAAYLTAGIVLGATLDIGEP